MTGFGAAEGPVRGGRLRIEVRSVNHRYFNLSLKAPADLAGLEAPLRERLRQEFDRGHLNVAARWVEVPAAEAAALVRLDLDRAREAVARLRELKTALGLAGEVTLDLIARQPQVFSAVEAEPAGPDWGEVEPIVREAATACRAMRMREGQVLTEELLGRLDLVERYRRDVAARAPIRLVRERDRLRAQVATLLEGRPVDDGRLEQELAFLAERLDVTEELVRLEAHLQACRSALASDRSVGKQLGFLSQEMGREVNTIGSKANDAEIQHAVVAMKGELERFREQLENLE